MNQNLRTAYICQTCSKRLSSKQGLFQHQNTHTGDKPYKCSYPNCFSSYRHASQLSNHKIIHKDQVKSGGEGFTDFKLFIKMMLTYFETQKTSKVYIEQSSKICLPRISFKAFQGKLPLAEQLLSDFN